MAAVEKASAFYKFSKEESETVEEPVALDEPVEESTEEPVESAEEPVEEKEE